MSFNNNTADAITRIRNALIRKHECVSVYNSKFVESILVILVQERFIKSYYINKDKDTDSRFINIYLRYSDKGVSVITQIRYITKSQNIKHDERLINIYNRRTLVIISTSQGVMALEDAREKGIGGIIIMEVY